MNLTGITSGALNSELDLHHLLSNRLAGEEKAYARHLGAQFIQRL